MEKLFLINFNALLRSKSNSMLHLSKKAFLTYTYSPTCDRKFTENYEPVQFLIIPLVPGP